MDSKDIIPVFPTPMAKQIMMSRLRTAEKGHNIMKRKSEVLQMKFRNVGKEIIEIKSLLGEIFKEASFLLAEARFVSGDFSQTVLSAVDKARVKVKHRLENIAGVQLRIFECYSEGSDMYGLTGLARGGRRLASLKRAYFNATQILVDLATLQTTFQILDEVIRGNNRRVNALEYLYIPKIERTLKYIDDELDERERQEFFIMKTLQKLKRENIKKMREEVFKIKTSGDPEGKVRNILEEMEDKDNLFA
ncbi:V-type proton ATPase subunit D-like [Stegodyphus dumicola]|uniref:V-type proton ATPase subunit D-like n=1 Tax=Stegodyphus dumicola TaxID=202533 RepID=UPI0015ADCE2C|nr:V-type proton ATPase subunit D-like [Stegodyphus dumicola]